MPAAQGALFSYEASFGSAGGPGGRFVSAAGLATDDAGRVYVADAGAGRVEVYDSAAGGNAFLLTIGQGQLVRPTGIAIDNRGRIYVGDAGRNLIVQYDAFVDGAPYRREYGGGGTELGRVTHPRLMTTDRRSQLYLVERDNVRVQFLRPAGGKPVAAFGVAEPATFLEPEGIARDRDGQIYVSDESVIDGEVRLYDPRGAYLKTVAGPGRGVGQVSSPRALVWDPADRLVVVDGGNARVQAFASPAAGSGALEAFGAAGTGPGRFSDPRGAALAPGALLYVADSGNGRVVRLRYDDADLDGALDARDNCRGLANGDQRDTERDGLGDQCDGDDDNDGIADGGDRCPRSSRGADANRDGCGDPRSRISVPSGNRAYPRRSAPSRIAGSADADELGVASVEVAVARVIGGRCAWFTGVASGVPARAPSPSSSPPREGVAGPRGCRSGRAGPTGRSAGRRRPAAWWRPLWGRATSAGSGFGRRPGGAVPRPRAGRPVGSPQ